MPAATPELTNEPKSRKAQSDPGATHVTPAPSLCSPRVSFSSSASQRLRGESSPLDTSLAFRYNGK